MSLVCLVWWLGLWVAEKRSTEILEGEKTESGEDVIKKKETGTYGRRGPLSLMSLQYLQSHGDRPSYESKFG